MSLKQNVYSVLILSSSDTFFSSLKDLMPESRFYPIQRAGDCSSASRLLSEQEFDLILINSPLPDGSGQTFAIDLCSDHSSVVLMMIRSELYEQLKDQVIDRGVFTLPKPVSKNTFLTALDWMTAARERFRHNEVKTLSVQEKMEEIRLVNRAKWILIRELKMDEPQAHRYIEKQAMDRCVSKREIAQSLISTYGGRS